MSYLAISLLGALIFSFYWWTVTKVFSGKGAAATVAVEQPQAAVQSQPIKLPDDLTEPQKGPVSLYVALTPQGGTTVVTLMPGQVITQDPDKKQYLLIIANKTISTFAPIELRLQFPYPIDVSEVLSQKDTDGVRFEPIGAGLTLHTIGGAGSGSVQVLRKPIYSNYQLRIDKMQPHGDARILITLNSWRDPRGKEKTIPKEEGARYMVPDWGPTLTYIDGYFKYRVGDEMVRKDFYAPLNLGDDKVVSLGHPEKAPKDLFQAIDMQ